MPVSWEMEKKFDGPYNMKLYDKCTMSWNINNNQRQQQQYTDNSGGGNHRPYVHRQSQLCLCQCVADDDGFAYIY